MCIRDSDTTHFDSEDDYRTGWRKKKSLSTTTVLFGTTFTRTIKLNLLLNHLMIVKHPVWIRNKVKTGRKRCTRHNYQDDLHEHIGHRQTINSFSFSASSNCLTGFDRVKKGRFGYYLPRTLFGTQQKCDIHRRFSGFKSENSQLWPFFNSYSIRHAVGMCLIVHFPLSCVPTFRFFKVIWSSK